MADSIVTHRGSTRIQTLSEFSRTTKMRNMLTLVLHSLSYPIQVNIRSSNGTDLTPSIQVLHSHISLSTLQQRSFTSTPISGCAQVGPNIPHSWCQRAVSPQDYDTSCTEPPRDGWTDPNRIKHIGQGKCASHEICVGPNTEGGDPQHQAPCVSTNHFVQIDRDPSDAAAAGVVTAGINSTILHENGSQVAVEAVLTSLSEVISLAAVSMVMQAQTYNGLWRTVENGHTYCLRCPSVTLAPFPEKVQRVKVDVVMPYSTPTGLLWLASYTY